MFITPHVLVGSTIAVATNNYPITIVGSFVSHFILDAIPHTDWGTWHGYNKKIKPNLLDYTTLLFDIIFAIAIFIYLIWFKHFDFWLILTAFFFSALPDIYLFDNLPISDKINFKFRDVWGFKQVQVLIKKLHFKLDKKYWFWGVLTQLIVIGGCLCLLALLSR